MGCCSSSRLSRFFFDTRGSSSEPPRSTPSKRRARVGRSVPGRRASSEIMRPRTSEDTKTALMRGQWGVSACGPRLLQIHTLLGAQLWTRTLRDSATATKARSNEIFGDLCRNVDAGHCLVLERRLPSEASCVSADREQICQTLRRAYEEIKKSGSVWRTTALFTALASPQTSPSRLERCILTIAARSRAASQSGTSPARYSLLFRKKLLAPGLCAGGTLCKPRDDSLRSQSMNFGGL